MNQTNRQLSGNTSGNAKSESIYTPIMNQLPLGTSLAGEIAKPSLDLAQDYAEMSIDSLTVSPIVKEIPIVKTVADVFKTGMAIREWHFVKKLLTFLKEFHAGSTETEATHLFRERLNSDSVFRERVASHLLVIIDRYVTTDKAQILAHLFRAHVNGQIEWQDFVNLSVVLDALQTSSYEFLEELANSARPFMYHAIRNEEAPLFAAGIAIRHGTKFSVTPLGKLLYQFGLKSHLKRA